MIKTEKQVARSDWKLALALSALAAATLAGCAGGGGGGSSEDAPAPGTTQTPTPSNASQPGNAPAPGLQAAASNDPAWYATPAVAGTGVRTITVTPGTSPSLQDALSSAQ